MSFLPGRENPATVVLENDSLRCRLRLDRGVWLESLVHKGLGQDLLEGVEPRLFLSCGSGAGYRLLSLEEERSDSLAAVTVTQRSSFMESPLELTQRFSLDRGGELRWQVSLAHAGGAGKNFREDQGIGVALGFPLLQQLRLAPADSSRLLFPCAGGYCLDDRPELRLYFTNPEDPRLPVDVFNPAAGLGVYFDLEFARPEDHRAFQFRDREDFRSRSFQVNLAPGERRAYLDCRIAPHPGDWHAAFEAFKRRIRDRFDFSYYRRTVQQDIRHRFVSHFTFLYGLDIYDPATNSFQLDRFLDEGERNFGGYDEILLWHDYPRQGVDRRDQFDLYEDLPGGLPGLRALVDRAHTRGVQVFIPYKPWDIIGARRDEFRQEARIAREIGADGIFLDTMDESDRAFRDALDEVSREIAFVAEGRPGLRSLELVTGSWNQNGVLSNQMPRVDLLRFVLPEHDVRNINRGDRNREALIQNALFNGVGLIVWEDIFGELNRFTWKERIMLHRYSRIMHENSDAFLTMEPRPLAPDLRDDLDVNAFPVAEKCLYPAWQHDRAAVDRYRNTRLIGPFLEVDHPADWHYIDLWNHQPIAAERQGNRTRLSFREETPDQLFCIAAFPPNLRADREGDSLRVSLARPLPGAVIRLGTVDNLTLIERERLTLPGTGGTVALAELELESPWLVLVKLMQDGLLRDELILDLGWKRFGRPAPGATAER